jgi:hypothetical protein
MEGRANQQTTSFTATKVVVLTGNKATPAMATSTQVTFLLIEKGSRPAGASLPPPTPSLLSVEVGVLEAWAHEWSLGRGGSG